MVSAQVPERIIAASIVTASNTSDSAINPPNNGSADSTRINAWNARALAWPRTRNVSCTAIRARSTLSRTAAGGRAHGPPRRLAVLRPAAIRACRPPDAPGSDRHRPRHAAPGRNGWTRQITIVSSVAHRHPAANAPASIKASPPWRGSSSASTSTTVSRLPTCNGACPQNPGEAAPKHANDRERYCNP